MPLRFMMRRPIRVKAERSARPRNSSLAAIPNGRSALPIGTSATGMHLLEALPETARQPPSRRFGAFARRHPHGGRMPRAGSAGKPGELLGHSPEEPLASRRQQAVLDAPIGAPPGNPSCAAPNPHIRRTASANRRNGSAQCGDGVFEALSSMPSTRTPTSRTRSTSRPVAVRKKLAAGGASARAWGLIISATHPVSNRAPQHGPWIKGSGAWRPIKWLAIALSRKQRRWLLTRRFDRSR